MDEALRKSGDWPNVALIPGTHTHAATGEEVYQPEYTKVKPSLSGLVFDAMLAAMEEGEKK